MMDDDSLEDEDPLAYDPVSTPFDEKDKMLLREMQGGAIIVDLGWFPEQYADLQPEEEEPVIPPREIFECQAMACECMSEIESMDDESGYEKMSWNQEMAHQTVMLVPIEIHMVQGPTGNYPRFWGYVCQYYPEAECWGAKKATISLPSGLSKRIAAFNEDMMNKRVDPLENSKVHMILTTYHGLEEFEVKDEKRKAHKFWNTRLIEGHRSPE